MREHLEKRVTQACMACPECQDRLEEMDILVTRVIVVMLDHRAHEDRLEILVWPEILVSEVLDRKETRVTKVDPDHKVRLDPCL